ncbi:MAG: 2-oxoglutarate dehydrogenase complex dihydrolipoyllysine-residue succinyltransferase [Chloroflexales bacterium]|nr:2-oxoglutarate dehydrogenase complex dihydrolipoyllysine-residue succinyltransferase [Chloroflexales bacterium]
MAVEIRVPTLGESIVEATVSRWIKQKGEAVAAGEPVVELETDKVNLEVAAEYGGVLSSIAKAEGETVAIGDVLAMLDETGAVAATAGDQRSNGGGEAHPGELTANVDDVGKASASTSLDGDVDVFATPVAQRVAAEHDIDVRQIAGSGSGGRVTKEDVLKHVQAATAQRPSSTLAESAERPAATQAPAASQPASSAQQPMAQSAITPAKLAPVPQQAQRMTSQPASDRPVASVAATPERQEERVRMSRRRQTIARRLVEAQQTAAMLTTFNEIDMSAVMELRKRRKDMFKERHGVGLGFMSFFTKAVVGALKAFPIINSEVQGDEIVLKYHYDIGIAVGAQEGLVVPVLRNADSKNFAQIEREIAAMAERARTNALTLPELQGGTFTISNGGIYGSLMSTPILNTPQVGILGMHKIEERPVVVNGQIVARPMMYVALSYDHRIIDGSEAVRFLVRVKELLEDPETLLLEG